MPQQHDDRIPLIKQRYSVIAEFRRDFGSIVRYDSGKDRLFCRCPFHDDHHASFVVDADGFRCFSARCGVTGDIIDYIMLRDKCSKADAIELLARGLNEARPAQRVWRPKGELVTVKLTYIDHLYANLELALPYFEHRAVTRRSGHQHKLGAAPAFYWHYTDRDGEKFRFEAPRYSIPNIRHGFDKGGNPIRVALDVNLRRDDASAIRVLQKTDRTITLHIAEELAFDRGVPVSSIQWEDMLDDCFGPKYWRKGSGTRMFNANAVVEPTQAGGYAPRRAASALLVEGEIDAMSLCEAGYRSIAVKYSSSLDLIGPLAGITQIYVIQDRDEDSINAVGRIVNGGRDNALALHKHLKESGRENVTIIETPVGFRDANEVIVKGEVKSWLMKYGLVPALAAS